jgi:uncharacterized CHY-type Zn-finger protein
MHSKDTVPIHGKPIDDATRCLHYHSPLDIIAIKFKCCNAYYPCYECHEETAGHPAQQWKKEDWNEPAVYCGMCKNEMSIKQYMSSGNQCPYCNASFNPNCSRHYDLYVEI